MYLSRRNFLITISSGLIAGCTIGLVCEKSPSSESKESPRKENSLEKVLLIGIDGLRPDALQKAEAPNIDRLIAESAYSFSAHTGTYTVSAPGWSNILTGVWEAKHGVKSNTIKNRSFEGANYGEFPNIFTRIEKYDPALKTYSIASLDWFDQQIITKADLSIYHPFEQEGDKKVAETSSWFLAHNNVDLMFTYFMGVDMAGHNHGFDPAVPEYISEIETIDGYVGTLMEAIKKRPSYDKERWLTILISDHGGKGRHHDGVGEEAKKVPFIMHGPAVQRGEIVPGPDQVDIAPIILTYLGVPLRPEWGLDGKVIGLKETH